MWRPTISSDELWHHGILGQKWGEQNGPPYPLGSGDHSAKEKKRGWKASLSAKDSKKRKKQLAKMYKAERRAMRGEQKLKAKGERDAKQGNKWATKNYQPSSFRSSLAAGNFAANPTVKNQVNLAIRNHADSIRYKAAKEAYAKADKYTSKKEAKQLIKKTKYKDQAKDWKAFSKMSKSEFDKEYNRRNKLATKLMNESHSKSKTKGESIAKQEAAETALKEFAKMYAYKRELEALRME